MVGLAPEMLAPAMMPVTAGKKTAKTEKKLYCKHRQKEGPATVSTKTATQARQTHINAVCTLKVGSPGHRQVADNVEGTDKEVK